MTVRSPAAGSPPGRRRRLCALAAAALLAPLGLAAAITETTEVKGTVPTDLVGRWLIAGQMRLPNGRTRPLPRLVEVRQGTEHLEVVLRRVQLPDPLREKVEATGEAGQGWTPNAAELRQVAERWDALPDAAGDYFSIESTLMGADAYPPEFQKDEVTAGSSVAIVIRERFSGGQPVMGTSSIYALRQRAGEDLSGTFVTSTIAAAPFPVPITLKGDFQAYRLDGLRGRSWLQRVLGLLSGCGRG